MCSKAVDAIKTLLIDNYDSFTCNLYHLIAEVNGVPPVLIRNDERDWSDGLFSQFDSIVLSPGPGRPDKPADFGWCANAVMQSTVPVLGICLGHQGICYFQGGKVVPAREVCHGRLSPVLHDGKGLFMGIPSPFPAVRYHSLMVDALPETVEVTARTADGVVMGIRHKTLPQWGVQFHPESVCTEYGKQLLANFRRLTERWWQDHPRSGSGTQMAFMMPKDKPVAWRDRKSWKLLHRVIDCEKASLDIETLFNDCFRKTGSAIWLDSSRSGYGSGRFSFLCAPSGPYGRIAVADVSKGTVTVNAQEGGTDVYRMACLDWLSSDIQSHQVVLPEIPVAFALGWMGYLGYELKAQCGAENVHQSPYPDAVLLFCDRGLVIDHQENRLYPLVLTQSGDEASANAWLNGINQKVEKMLGQSQHKAPLPEILELTQPITLEQDKDTYIAKIRTCQELIRQGETYEICLTNMVYGATDAAPWTVYRLLRKRNPAPYSVFMQFEGISIISCSPEQFIRVSRQGEAVSRPIKGTRPRRSDKDQDLLMRQELAESEKERAENLMIVDLVRHDLGWTAETGSVRVPERFAVESYQTVHQMVSTVSSKIRKDSSPCQCIRYAFPGGSMTGAPKKRTMEILDRLENTARGIYSGALGYFSLCGAVDLSIVIRTIVMQGDGRFSFGVGGAVTALSDPEMEFEETRDKARAFLDLFNTDFPDD